MTQQERPLLFVGIKHGVVALDAATGDAVWSTELRSGDFVTVLWDGDALYAANAGEVWRLDPANGAVPWHNDLRGQGRGIVSLASSQGAHFTTSAAPGSAAKHHHDETAAQAALIAVTST